jgi:choline-sulfatase
MTMSTVNRRPNILFLMTDQQRADFAGFAGHPVVRTPTLDRLAREGAVFRSAYAASPVCVPGRQCMMAGQLPRTCGAEVYGDDLPPGHMTFARRFAQYGYTTACAGKLHHLGTDQMQGWTRRLGWWDMHVDPRYIDGAVSEEFARYPQEKMWSHVKEIRMAGPGISPYRKNDDYTVEGCLLFIEEYFGSPVYDRQQTDTPLLLKLSLQQPHYPYVADPDKFNYYLNRVEPFTAKPVLDHYGFGADWAKALPGTDVTPREVQKALAAYCAMIETCDDAFRRVFDALAHLGQDLDDWIVVFTSDHGDMMGENNLWWKLKFYEGSVRVPLVVRAPKFFAGGREIRSNVSHCDLFATLCSMAGIPVPPGLDSRDLSSLLRGDETDWDDEAVSQIGRNRLMIKRGSVKYMFFGESGDEVLFDLACDPDETENLVGLPEYQALLPGFRARRGALGHDA